MVKAKRKAKVKAKASGIKPGERVKVLSGDYGQARGVVETIWDRSKAAVRLDNQVHGDPVTFALANLAPAGRVRYDR